MKMHYVKEMPFYFYLARCSDNALYAGSCINVENRELEHNKGKTSKFTRERRPVKIVYTEAFPDILSAMRREQQIKGWRRDKKERLIRGKHPTKDI